MSSSEKTDYLQLNAWLGTDRPQRIDFVDDNQRIDEAIRTHVLDSAKHCTTEEKNKLENPYVMQSYGGTGTATKTITLTIEPRFIIVFMKNSAPMETDSSGNILVNQCFTAKSNGGMGGAVISGSEITVNQSQTATNGLMYNLNKLNGQYCIVAFR